jgi:hypothetical protein
MARPVDVTVRYPETLFVRVSSPTRAWLVKRALQERVPLSTYTRMVLEAAAVREIQGSEDAPQG